MIREQFQEKYPEEYERQEKSGRKSMYRFIGLILAGVAAYNGIDNYCGNPQFREKVDAISMKVLQKIQKVLS